MNMKKIANMVTGLVVVIGFLLAVSYLPSYLQPHGLFMPERVLADGGESGPGPVSLTSYILRRTAQAGDIIARFYLTNNSIDTISRVRIDCIFLDKQNRYVDTATWLLHQHLMPETSGVVSVRDRKFIHSRAMAQPQSCMVTDVGILPEPLVAFHRHASSVTHHAPENYNATESH